MYVVADWAGNGWFAVLHDDGAVDGRFYPTLWNLWREWGDQIHRLLIDIPIGLCTDTKRACDVDAKRYLGGKQQSSVFYTPIREAVYARNLERAKQEHVDADVDFGIQNQAWSLVPRIREIDAFVADCSDSESILETHPEACFVAFNGSPLDDSKKSEEGIEERLRLLDGVASFDVREFYENACSEFREPSYAPMVGSTDDIIDALVAAITAASTDGSLPSLPRDEEPDRDEVLDRDIEIKLPVVSD